MPKVTSVEPQKSSYAKASERRGIRRFNIFLDGQFAFGADEDLVVKRRLIVGKEILQEELEKILFEAEVGKLIERMYGLFNIRARSEKEIRQKLTIINYQLTKKGQESHSDLVIEETINKLKQKGLINDEEFAKTWVESRRRSKNKGKIALKQELLQKGISKEIIDEQLSIGTEVTEEQLAKQALEKKINSWKNLPILTFKKKAYNFLLYKGFDYDTIRKVVGVFIKSEI